MHPGYGFLSENADFAAACAEAGLTFVGPTPEQLELFGDKARARAQAQKCKVPVLPGTDGAIDLAGADGVLQEAREGGHRAQGDRRRRRARHAAGHVARARSPTPSRAPAAEAKAAFGNGDLYAERLVGRARHIEVQIVGDGKGGIVAPGRARMQPAAAQPEDRRDGAQPEPRRRRCARRSSTPPSPWRKAVKYRSLGTFEFLVDEATTFFFIEANPRLQVEHTVTEEVTGVDLVKAQLRLAGGATLAELGLDEAPRRAAMRSSCGSTWRP